MEHKQKFVTDQYVVIDSFCKVDEASAITSIEIISTMSIRLLDMNSVPADEWSF